MKLYPCHLSCLSFPGLVLFCELMNLGTDPQQLTSPPASLGPEPEVLTFGPCPWGGLLSYPKASWCRSLTAHSWTPELGYPSPLHLRSVFWTLSHCFLLGMLGRIELQWAWVSDVPNCKLCLVQSLSNSQ
jgi:hypothetical protein